MNINDRVALMIGRIMLEREAFAASVEAQRAEIAQLQAMVQPKEPPAPSTEELAEDPPTE